MRWQVGFFGQCMNNKGFLETIGHLAGVVIDALSKCIIIQLMDG